MVQQDDIILEGVTEREVASLRALAKGGDLPAPGEMAPLRAKGWIEVIGKDAIITLTGRALLDGRPSGLR